MENGMPIKKEMENGMPIKQKGMPMSQNGMPMSQNGKKEPQKSVESPQPPPTPPQKSPLYLGEAANLYFNSRSGCLADLKVDCVRTLSFLLDDGFISLDDGILRCDESLKQSWEIRSIIPGRYEESLYRVFEFTPSEKEEVQKYLSAAAQSEYFDIPDPKTRPSRMLLGFFEVYPEGQPQKDPVFEKEPNFLIKLPPLVSKLGVAVVEFHNNLTGSNLSFLKVEKANMAIWRFFQPYFITLKAFDNLSGKEVTCRSRVVCQIRHNPMANISKRPMVVENTFVESFHRVG